MSGSNISGKSTLLRTVGTNAVLALAGAPVRARRLRLCPLAVGATLRIQDSLQAGRSRFYAEIVRIRQLVDLSRGPLPLLFLLDELLQGTNSHDRLIGAQGVVRGLLAAGALGLITTHDLALANIADDARVDRHDSVARERRQTLTRLPRRGIRNGVIGERGPGVRKRLRECGNGCRAEDEKRSKQTHRSPFRACWWRSRLFSLTQSTSGYSVSR